MQEPPQFTYMTIISRAIKNSQLKSAPVYATVPLTLTRKVVTGMKQSYFTDAKELFHGSSIVRKYTFKATESGDSYALLAVANRHLAHDFALAGDKCALFQQPDCFECLSPHNIAV